MAGAGADVQAGRRVPSAGSVSSERCVSSENQSHPVYSGTVMRYTTSAVSFLLLSALAAAQSGLPRFEPDPSWPKPLPNNWMLGQVSGTAVDSRDHIWVLHRSRTLDD